MAEFGHTTVYEWYAGVVEPDAAGNPVHVPVEFGSASLSPSDPLMQSPCGMIGALIIEPQGSCWTADPNSCASPNVYGGAFVKGRCDGSELLFREHDFDDSNWSKGRGPFSSSGESMFGPDGANVNEPFGPGQAPPLPPDGYIPWNVDFDP